MARAMNTIPSSSSLSVSELSLSSSSELTITSTGAAARQGAAWGPGTLQTDPLHPREKDLVPAQPRCCRASELAVGRHRVLTPCRTRGHRLPPASPASCQGTPLCVLPLGASLVREMSFCRARGTWLGPALCKPRRCPQVALSVLGKETFSSSRAQDHMGQLWCDGDTGTCSTHAGPMPSGHPRRTEMRCWGGTLEMPVGSGDAEALQHLIHPLQDLSARPNLTASRGAAVWGPLAFFLPFSFSLALLLEEQMLCLVDLKVSRRLFMFCRKISLSWRSCLSGEMK